MSIGELMRPSAQFLKKFANQPSVLKLIKQYEKEYAIFSYLSERVPHSLGDKEWSKTLETRTREERVKLWDFIALTQVREKNDIARRGDRKEAIKLLKEHQNDIYNAGGMGYGKHCYRLLLDPVNSGSNDAEHIFETRQLSVSRLNDQPTLALDLQYVSEEKYATRSRLLHNVQYFIKENRTIYHRPFPLELINVNRKNSLLNTFINEIGIFSRTAREANFPPTMLEDNPYYNLKRESSKEVVYISRHARDMIDGPLRHDAYILPVTFDAQRQSIGGARSARIRPMSLPIKKYIKWESGPQFLPLTTIQKVLYDVSRNGGDWETALRQNISIRHIDLEKKNSEGSKMHREVARFRADQRAQILRAIEEALPIEPGLQQQAFAAR